MLYSLWSTFRMNPNPNPNPNLTLTLTLTKEYPNVLPFKILRSQDLQRSSIEWPCSLLWESKFWLFFRGSSGRNMSPGICEHWSGSIESGDERVLALKYPAKIMCPSWLNWAIEVARILKCLDQSKRIPVGECTNLREKYPDLFWKTFYLALSKWDFNELKLVWCVACQ